jgi:hypothetical protein
VNVGKLGCNDSVAVAGGVILAEGVGYGGSLFVTATVSVCVCVNVMVCTIHGTSVVDESGTIMTVPVKDR